MSARIAEMFAPGGIFGDYTGIIRRRSFPIVLIATSAETVAAPEVTLAALR
jgi:hypothetical protein